MSVGEGIIQEDSEEISLQARTDSFFSSAISNLGDNAPPSGGQLFPDMKKKPSALIKWRVMQNKIKEQITLEEISK